MIDTSVTLSFGNHGHAQSSAVKAAKTVKEVLGGNETQRQGKDPDSAQCLR